MNSGCNLSSFLCWATCIQKRPYLSITTEHLSHFNSQHECPSYSGYCRRNRSTENSTEGIERTENSNDYKTIFAR